MAAMEYLLYSFLFICLYVYLGLGTSLLCCPKSLKKYALLLAPMLGYCYLALVGWYCYNFELGGTDVYAWAILLPPAFLIGLEILKRRRRPSESVKLFNGNLLIPLVVSIISFLILSTPFFRSTDGLTSMSLLNNDVADYASNARYLKEFARSDTVGFLGQGDFKYIADNQVFAPSLSTAFAGSLFSLETYELQSLSVHVFFLFGVLLVYALARESFGYNRYAATGITALYGLNPIMYYTVYQGFQSQIIAIALALCIFLLNLQAIENCKKFSDYYPYISLAVLFNWGFSLTYPHMLPFVYTPIVIYLLLISFHSKSYSFALRWISFVVLTLSIAFIMSPYRAKALISYLIIMGRVGAGWFMPWFSPDVISGVTFILSKDFMHLQPSTTLIRAILSIPLILVVAFGFLNTGKTDRKLFLLAGSSLFVVLTGYTILSFMGRTEIGWGGYKSYKLISFFLPLVLLSSLILYRNIEFTLKYRGRYVLLLSLAALIGCNGYSAYNIAKQMSLHGKEVSRNMADLKKIEDNRLIESINILGTDWWDIMWETNFLMRKKLYFETSTYGGRSASNLDGQWDLLMRSKETSNQSTFTSASDETISVNSMYLLKKVRRLSEETFRAKLTPAKGSLKMKPSSVSFIPIKVKNMSNSNWSFDDKRRIHLSYHWLDKSGKLIIVDGLRTPLPNNVKPRQELTLNARIVTPNKQGHYMLEFDVVQERVTWFKDKGSKTALLDVKIE